MNIVCLAPRIHNMTSIVLCRHVVFLGITVKNVVMTSHIYSIHTHTHKQTQRENLYFGLFAFACCHSYISAHHQNITDSCTWQALAVCVCVFVSVMRSNSILFHYRCWFLWKHYRFRKTTLFKLFVHVWYATHSQTRTHTYTLTHSILTLLDKLWLRMEFVAV